MACNLCEVICKNILNRKSQLNLNGHQEVQVERVVGQVSQSDHFAICVKPF
ncbi:uncharacterized protein G2W53_007593 [Senna tora]|uniref:Uncharacterized protein n=1 Tax=Senna tora TaxID=362788 RepID=A0A835CDU0_9FABA|nr:uncharacterized protein G2W53_007593 [Senna tora]